MKASPSRLACLGAAALAVVCGCVQVPAPPPDGAQRRSRHEERLAEAEGEDRAYLLGMVRAEAVRDHLVSLGVAPDRIEVTSRAWWLPQDSRGTSAPALDRRAQTVALDEPESLRGSAVAVVHSPALGRAVYETVGDTVYFTSGSWALGAEAQRSLRNQAEWLLDNPGVRVRIVGHADREAG